MLRVLPCPATVCNLLRDLRVRVGLLGAGAVALEEGLRTWKRGCTERSNPTEVGEGGESKRLAGGLQNMLRVSNGIFDPP